MTVRSTPLLLRLMCCSASSLYKIHTNHSSNPSQIHLNMFRSRNIPFSFTAISCTKVVISKRWRIILVCLSLFLLPNVVGFAKRIYKRRPTAVGCFQSCIYSRKVITKKTSVWPQTCEGIYMRSLVCY